MSDYTYQIVPFIFKDGIAPKAVGAHFYIPEGKWNNVILFGAEEIMDKKLKARAEKYTWRVRAVSGSGWVLGWHPERGVQSVWVSPDLEENPVIEFGKNWIAALIASPNCGQFVVEGIDRPDYIAEAERVVVRDTHSPIIRTKRGGFMFPLGNFWQEFDRLTKKDISWKSYGR